MKENEIPNAAMNIDSVICNIGTRCYGRIMRNVESKVLHATSKMQKQKMPKQEQLYVPSDTSETGQKR